MKNQMNIAFYDFDGTITSRDTMLELAKFKDGETKFFLSMMLLVPYFLLHQIKIITNTKFKEAFLSLFFGNMDYECFRNLCFKFCEQKLDGLIRKEALATIQTQLEKNIPVVVVTASASIWVEPWCQKKGIMLLASELEVKDGKVSGRLKGKNCHGHEKVARIRAAFDLSMFTNIHCYGDSPGDKPMLALATHPHYKPFE